MGKGRARRKPNRRRWDLITDMDSSLDTPPITPAEKAMVQQNAERAKFLAERVMTRLKPDEGFLLILVHKSDGDSGFALNSTGNMSDRLALHCLNVVEANILAKGPDQPKPEE